MPCILVVCTANICRSPVVEALIHDKLQSNNYDMNEWRVESVGTWAEKARRPARYSIRLMAERDIDISHKIAQMLEEEHIIKSDLVLCLSGNHAEAIKAEFRSHAHKVFLLSEMIGKRYDISDPIGKPYDDFQRMFQAVSKIVDEGFDTIVTHAQTFAAERITP